MAREGPLLLISLFTMNIFVARLNYRTNEDSLQKLFENYGEVSSAKIIFDRIEGRSKGFGFVEMADDEAAQKAIDELNDTEFEGRQIVVKKANPRPERAE